MLAVAILVTTPEGVKRINLIEIQNDATGVNNIANYDVRLKDGYDNLLAGGRVHGHNRDDGAMSLVHKAIHAIGGDYERTTKPRGE